MYTVIPGYTIFLSLRYLFLTALFVPSGMLICQCCPHLLSLDELHHTGIERVAIYHITDFHKVLIFMNAELLTLAEIFTIYKFTTLNLRSQHFAKTFVGLL